MVNMFEKNGTYIVEIKVQSKEEKSIVDRLEGLNRHGMTEQEYWSMPAKNSKKVPSLDDEWKLAGDEIPFW